jgi:hypothetical protein
MNYRALVFPVALVLAGATASAQGDVFLVSVSFPPTIEEEFGAEHDRVAKLCSYPDPECWSRNLALKTWTLNPVRSAPDAKAPQIGTIVVVSVYEPGAPYLRFDYRAAGGRQATWLNREEIGDWGYGIEVVTLAKGKPSQGDQSTWIRLGGVTEPAWLELPPILTAPAEGLEGELAPLTERICTFEARVPATNRVTRRTATLPSSVNYVVERVSGGQLWVRREVGADMPCADDDEKDVATPATPRYRVPIGAVFTKSGKPRLKLAYPKGC